MEWLGPLPDWSQFRFLRPQVLAALLLLPLAFWWLRRAHAQRGAWAQLIDPALQRFVLTRSLDTGSKRGSWLSYLISALLILALAGPTWEQLPQPVYTQQRPVVIALDLSQSMNAQDLIPSRLQVAKIKLRDILRERRDGQTALITFAGDAFLVTPLTDDTRTIVSMLPSLTPRIMPSQGSRLAPPLEMAQQVLADAGGEPGEVVLISDGVSDLAESEDAASALAKDGHRVSVIALGTAQGGLIKDARGEFLRDRRGEMVMAPLDKGRLRAVSRSGGGALYDYTLTDVQLAQLLNRELGDFSRATGTEQEFATDLWREQGPLLVLLCLPFVALAFRKGVLLGLVLAFIVVPQPEVYAGLWDDAWKRPDQQGASAFEREEFATAAELFEHREWQAASLYRAGEFEQSAATLDGIDTSEAHYNRGNALAKAQALQPAIEAYERTLELEPEHEDARFNLELLKQAQQEQQQDQNQEQNQDGEQEQESEQSQDGEGENDGQPSDQDGEEQDESQDGESSEQEQGEEEQTEEREGQTEEERQAERERQQAQLAEQMTEEEQQQAVEQWLRRIPDDPGGLLRRKFKRQYRERGPAPRQSGEDW